MGNPHRGEVSFEVEGKRYKISFSANALCEAEDYFDQDPGEALAEAIGDKPGKGRLQRLRRFFWLGLGDHHPEIDFDGAKALLKHIQPIDMARLIGQAFNLAMTEAKDDAPHPPQPDRSPDGTGPAS